MTSTALNAARRNADLTALADGAPTDVVVIGGGITGAGIALDAASRGLRVTLVEKHDLAFGTSRWSSKLVHGGLRYLATGNVGIARRSAVERGILMTRNAPHLVRAMPQLVPLLPSMGRVERALVRAGFLAGDVLRKTAGTPGVHSAWLTTYFGATRHRYGAGRSARWSRRWSAGLRRTTDRRRPTGRRRRAYRGAAGCPDLDLYAASEVTGTSLRLTDQRTGESFDMSARAVINATGVWAGEIDPSLKLRPSRGTHLVFDAKSLGNPTAALTIPIPGELNRFVFAMPEQLGRVYLGLTDEESPGPIPDVPQPTSGEVEFLLDVVNTALDITLDSADVIGAYAGLRPLIDTGAGRTADVSRDHAVIESPSGVISVIGGKLTEYRHMAEDVLDRAIELRELDAGECRTRNLPLVGAPANPGSTTAPMAGLPESLVLRYGAEAANVIAAAACERPADPVADGIDVIRAEFEYAITHEGALTVDDILDRRTRIGLVTADRERVVGAAEEFLSQFGRGDRDTIERN